MPRIFRSIFILHLFLFTGACAQKADNTNTKNIGVKEGFELSIAVDKVKNPRFLQIDEDGHLYISLPGKGEIKSCRDNDGDGYFESISTFIEGHRTVHGMHYHDGWLWFAETGAIFKARDTNDDGVADEKITILADGDLPKGGGHWWRPVLIHKDRIYTAIGCSGNITEEVESERLKIFSFKTDGSDKKQFADGLRNTEKLLIRPGTDEIWGMDHGSDWFGREIEKKSAGNSQPITDFNPPCEMNHYREGKFYGHPYITGHNLPRYEYMDKKDIVQWAEKNTPPEWSTGAHWAPNAMCFYDGKQFPADNVGDAFVAYHGSWNRSEKGGYALSRVFFENGKPYGELKYLDFLNGKEMYGRPVDVIVASDGSLLISDDWGNKVYRLSYKAAK